MEDAISATGVNSEDKKFLKLGINAEADSWYLEDQNKYDVDGPKTLNTQDMLIDWYMKLCNEHPLLEYIEDPMAVNDIRGYRVMVERFAKKYPHVKVGVKNWFKSDIDIIQEYTQIIQPQEEEEDELDEEQKEEEELDEEEKKRREEEEEQRKQEELARQEAEKKALGDKKASQAKGKGKDAA